MKAILYPSKKRHAMDHFETVKQYLLELEADITTEIPESELIIISLPSKGIHDMILDCEGDVLVLEQIIIPIREERPEYYQRLLQINRTLIHGAFVLNDSQDFPIIAFRDTLQLPNLDLNELEGTFNALTFALVENMDTLLELSGQASA